jgi:hypothetical protein
MIRKNHRRRGLTLTELLIAGTIMTMLAGGMGSLVLTVHSANEYCRGQSVAAQHARISLDRIQRAVRTAEAELRAPNNNSPVPAVTNAAGWKSLIDSLRSSADASRTELTSRLRTSPVTNGSSDLRGAIRFRVLLAPSAEYWAEYRGGTRTWKDLNWPLDYVSTQTGLRRVVCQTEMHILASGEDAAQTSVPFFGSTALNYELAR